MHEERACPQCGSVMRKTRRGGGKRRQDAWVCPCAEAERVTDERGHITTIAAALHPWLRVWTADELETEKTRTNDRPRADRSP